MFWYGMVLGFRIDWSRAGKILGFFSYWGSDLALGFGKLGFVEFG